jgi:lysyl-tRNA synthetase class 2
MMTEQESLAFKRTRLELRSRVLNAVREFFLNAGFLEVQTPVRTPAPAPEVHIDAIPADGWFLAASPELYMKRLLAAGYEKIFQISPVFRRGEVGRLHHPEFTLLEWYRLGADYTALQEDCERLLGCACRAAGREGGWLYRGRSIEVEGPWRRYTVKEAFRRFAGWEPDADPDQDRFDVDMVEKVEPNLGFPFPCFLVDYPASQAALARLKPEDPSVAERFELYWASLELANGFSELTDPTEQRQRFEAANEARRRAGRVAYPPAETFLQSLDHLPACAGIALGVDRLIMLLSDADHIDQVVAFPPGS